MRISELSPELRRPFADDGDSQQSYFIILNEIDSSVNEVESLSLEDLSSLENLAARLRKLLSRTSSTQALSDSAKLQVWKLSYRLWNACVDFSNAADILLRTPEPNHHLSSFVAQAELRQVASELLLLAENPKGISSPAFKAASFFHKTGLIWHDLGKLDRAAANFEQAANLTSSSRAQGEDEKRLLLDLNIARARTAWEAKDRSLSMALLGRSKNFLFGSAAGFQTLAEQYLQFAKSSLKSSSEVLVSASKLLTEALDLCEKGIAISKAGATLDLERLKVRCLRFMAAERLQEDDYDGVLSCVRVLRGIEGKEEHPSVGYVAMKAYIGAGRVVEAERELRGIMTKKGVPETACISAAEAFLVATGPESAKSIMTMLLERCRGGAGAALRVVRMVVESGGCAVRARVAADLASDDRVVALFVCSTAAKERNTMQGLLWNWGAERFRSKEYEISSELFEKSMLYVPRDEENRARRSNCFRVLCLCYLALGHLDRAQEFIEQAQKLEPNIKCSFLKFKILLQKEDEQVAIDEINTMVGCIDFNPEFLALCTHEAIACKSFPVAAASLSVLLSLYSPGKPMLKPEVAVIRNLITLLLRCSENEAEIQRHMRLARLRMNELGIEGFFGKGAAGSRELSWFAASTWNMGLKMGKDKKYENCAEFFELAAEFYGACTNENEGKQAMVCKALILSTGAMINAEEEKKAVMIDSNVKKAIEMLHRAGKILPTMPLSTSEADDQLLEASIMNFLHTFNTYQLLNRLDDTRNQQLQLIKSFTSSKACNPNSLLQIGLFASQGGRPNIEVAEFSLSKCLTCLLESPTPDYQMVSMVLRRLIGITNYVMEDGRNNEAAYAAYKQAYQIIVGLNKGEYPVEEGKWLAMTAWNRSATAIRLQQVATARKWMKMGLDLAKRMSGMEKYAEEMEECFTNFEKVCSGDSCRVECGQIGLSSQAAL